MESSLRIVPAQGPKTTKSETTNSLGLHDTLQYGPRSMVNEFKSHSAIKDRLENWEETRDNTKLTLMRNLYGVSLPLQIMMERKIVAKSAHMPALPQSNIHLDILMGRDESLEVSDVFGGVESKPSMDIHGEMEMKLRM
ncbi:proteasome maturation factor UMP1 [Thelephora terrestris]|uniref:Proteasome maturation factor UMP1 n=1 Tax=Thelephora terrestris TaxID=56493 RepID=A0A9P6LBZ2_9AGAM|nr:proteasome maturation factor UMP1 [Thelephora terrestris]